MKSPILIFCTLAFAIISCKKDAPVSPVETPAPPKQATIEELVVGKWKPEVYTTTVYAADGSVSQPAKDSAPGQYDGLTLEANFTYTQTGFKITSGTYSIQKLSASSGTINNLILTSSSLNTTYKINSVTATQLILEYSSVNASNVKTVVVYKYNKTN